MVSVKATIVHITISFSYENYRQNINETKMNDLN